MTPVEWLASRHGDHSRGPHQSWVTARTDWWSRQFWCPTESLAATARRVNMGGVRGAGDHVRCWLESRRSAAHSEFPGGRGLEKLPVSVLFLYGCARQMVYHWWPSAAGRSEGSRKRRWLSPRSRAWSWWIEMAGAARNERRCREGSFKGAMWFGKEWWYWVCDPPSNEQRAMRNDPIGAGKDRQDRQDRHAGELVDVGREQE